MPELIEDGDLRAIRAGDIRLVFRWTGDRWVHWLELKRRDRPTSRVLAASVEGDTERDDPSRVVSPVYQQLQFQRNGESLEALLVGQSGSHHFSAVFAVEDEFVQGVEGRDAAKPILEVLIKVNVADRCRGEVEVLASTYTVNARSGELTGAGPDLAAWEIDSDDLTFSPSPPAKVSLAEAGRRATQVQAFAGLERGSATHRLIYHWIWRQNLPLDSGNPF